MEKVRKYKSRSGAEYELVQVKEPTKRKRQSAGKAKKSKDGIVAVRRKDGGLDTYGSAEEYRRYTRKAGSAKRKKRSSSGKAAARSSAVKRARKSTAKRAKKPGPSRKKKSPQLSMF